MFSRLRVYGKERVPRTGGIVIACNHFSWLDPATLGAACPRTLYYMAKIEAHRVPGLGQLIRAFGTFSVRRGESDREAVRMMRQVVREGKALGLFVEGTRQRSGVPGEIQPGAAMVALQEGVPIVPVAMHGSQTWKPGNFHPVSIAFGTPMTFEALPKGGRGYREASALLQGEIRRPVRLARRAARARPAARRDAAVMRPENTAPRTEIAGTVAIVGFPNVGKSTLMNRLTESRAAVVHETPGVTRDRKELLCEWNGTWFRLIDTGGVDAEDKGPFGPQIAAQARIAVEEADLVLFIVDTRAGVTPGDVEMAEILRVSKTPVIVLANKIDDPRRDTDALEFHRLGLGDPLPISALHGHGSGDLLDEIVARLPGGGETPSARRRSASRSWAGRTSASRRS